LAAVQFLMIGAVGLLQTAARSPILARAINRL
jgi:hypothetical protein